MKKEDIKVGTQFIRRGTNRKDVETVVDIHKTYNLAGELVKERYVATHEFMGQTVTDRDVVAPTIQMGNTDVNPEFIKAQKRVHKAKV